MPLDVVRPVDRVGAGLDVRSEPVREVGELLEWGGTTAVEVLDAVEEWLVGAGVAGWCVVGDGEAVEVGDGLGEPAEPTGEQCAAGAAAPGRSDAGVQVGRPRVPASLVPPKIQSSISPGSGCPEYAPSWL